MNDDSKLIEQTLAGESAAFGHLVTKYQDRLYNSIAHMTGGAEDARDLVQDAFVQAFVKLESFRQSSSFFTWLYRIAFNLTVSHHRRKKPTVSVERVKDASGREPIEPGEGPEGHAERKETCQQVRQAIATLADEHRAVLVLREIDGCDYETIASILELPVGTVRSRLSRARGQLRHRLADIEGKGQMSEGRGQRAGGND
ncbi:MAG: sigma-70 family RNA polymerase sigma factor [Pirellulales bacterium]|nr:sigma-70 family RNA polymerase sigma factor [Pirellulales bacterium]